MSLPRWGLAAVCAASLAAACSDEDPVDVDDVVRPEVTIVQPAEAAFVSPRPRFEITFSDQGTGVFCTSTDASIDGTDYSQFFRVGCDEDAGELIVPSGTIIPPLPEGGKTLTFTISDHAGNETTERVTFTVQQPPPPPPPPPAALVPPPA
ncbi:MAG TPA: hypothetical protein VIC56_05165 [Gemmatimonadota bacterium]|jgi:hypothetical protein